MYSPNLLTFREKLGVGGPPLLIWHYAGGEVYGKSVSQAFLLISLWHFLICQMSWSHSDSFWISLRGNCSMCSCIQCVAGGGRKFRNLMYHLGPKSILRFLIFASILFTWELYFSLVFLKLVISHPLVASYMYIIMHLNHRIWPQVSCSETLPI